MEVSVKLMVPGKALAVALPLALVGAWAIVASTQRVERLRGELTSLEETGRMEADSFLRTLEGEHVGKQLEAYDRRRLIALQLGVARRNQLLGVLGIVAAGLVAAGAMVFRRVAAELEEDRHLVHRGRP